ncbi:GspE/PulE/PilB domain-containing protein, partial [Leisingera sp. ANG-S5]|uniref:GspE/PulE/PilB domain-containing protein n=1 Tax=Leisingera sp. ANG-S5 TaxID=1577901 RepID=UPI00406CCB34
MPRADLSGQMANSRLLACKPARFWLRHCAVPWMQLGRTVTVAVAPPPPVLTPPQGTRGRFPPGTPALGRGSPITAPLSPPFCPPPVPPARRPPPPLPG